MKVNFTETALAEVDEILAYIASHKPAAAIATRERFERAAAHLSDFPYSAPMSEEAGVRQMAVRISPYLIFYSIQGEEAFILHVWHGARRRPWEQAD